VVPQTGKAVEGVCPRVVQVCAYKPAERRERKITTKDFTRMAFTDRQKYPFVAMEKNYSERIRLFYCFFFVQAKKKKNYNSD